MNFFKRKKAAAINPKAEALAIRIADSIIGRQTRIAAYLNRKTQHWNRASKIVALLLFTLLFGAICLYFIIKSFNHL
ncbi:hypothetical protein [Mucilaginibacter sp.]|jgi:hypothetical protein|uniref:hypothetical protein n=1 Tax=Mucilaginibacter sp. TaxID=1882438 RepID=UPI003565F1B1